MIPDELYDIIVVGAGPAGATAATYAADAGMSVLLVDKKKDIGVPLQCGGFLTHKEVLHELVPDAELPYTLEDYPVSCVHNVAHCQRFIAPDGYSREFAVEGDAIDRRRFDKYLVKQASKSGAEVMVGTSVKEVNGTHLVMEGVFGEFEVDAKVVIGADGPNSIVARSNGLTKSHDPMASGTAFEYELTGVDVDRSAVEMYFGNQYVPGGYAWIISQGDDNANIGVGVREAMFGKNMCARDYLEHFMHDHPIASEKIGNGCITSVVAGLVPVGGAPRITATKDTLIAGDAAGHIIATNGGGIATSMVGGKVAGQTAASYLKGECDLIDYDRNWRMEMGLEIKTSVYVRKLMDNLMRSDRLMSAAIRSISEDQMMALQCGRLPEPVKKLLMRLNPGL